jgi:diguanylate cyclase (GGDEF)-like protein/PAS domain S-box-containing protein
MLLAAGVLAVLIALLASWAIRRDLDELERGEQALRSGEHRFRQVAETSSDLVRLHDRSGRVIYSSPSSMRLLGYSPDEMCALSPASLVPQEERAHALASVESFLARGQTPPPLVHQLRRKDATLRWYETRIEPILDNDGAIRRFHTASRDVTERIRAEQRSAEKSADLQREADGLRAVSTQDDLTGLLNRRGLFESAAAVARVAELGDQSMAVYFCDLDGLKAINDSLGHEFGSRAIQDGARLLRDVARAGDVVGRLGGDEFVMICALRHPTDAPALRDRVAARIERHEREAARPYRLAISIGIAEWSRGVSFEDVLAEADAMMYVEKRRRRSANTAATGEGHS